MSLGQPQHRGDDGSSREAVGAPPRGAVFKRRLLRLGAGLLLLLLASFGLDRLLPSLGVRLLRPTPYAYPAGLNIERDMLEYRLHLKTNTVGLRAASSPQPLPGVSVHRGVLVLGDEQTAGRGVAPDATFSARLDEALPGVPVVNGGVDGANPLQQARLYHSCRDLFRPSLVLLCISGDDLADMVERRFDDPLPPPEARSLPETLWPNLSGHLAARGRAKAWERIPEPFDVIGSAVSKARSARNLSREAVGDWTAAVRAYPQLVEAAGQRRLDGNLLTFGLLWKNRWADSLDMNPWRDQRAWPNLKTVLAWMKAQVAAQGGLPAVAFIPAKVQYDEAYLGFLKGLGYNTTSLWLSERSRFQIALGRWCGDHGLPFHDLTPAFRRAENTAELSRRYGAELTEKGHALVAEQLAPWLREQLREHLGEQQTGVDGRTKRRISRRGTRPTPRLTHPESFSEAECLRR